MNKKIFTPTLGSLFIIAGLGTVFGSFLSFNHTQEFIKTASTVEGTVIEIRQKISKKSITYFPVFKYQTHQGKIVHIESSVGTNPPNYGVGAKVNVIYDPNDPNQAEINSFWSVWLLTVVFGALGSLFTGIGLLLHLNEI